MEDTITIQSTTEYGRFKTMHANREQTRGHIERLKEAFVEYGNLTKVQPILVNQDFEIIDGQHRFTAAMELGEPIYFTVGQGLGIREARSMNILHNSWTTDDYARSYANSGDASYSRYMKLREEFPQFGHSIVLNVVHGAEKSGAFREFRNGDFVLTPEQFEQARIKLVELEQVSELVTMGHQKEFNYAILKCMNAPGFEMSRLLAKLKLYGPTLQRYANAVDYLRALEEIYNKGMGETNRVRLY